MCVSLRRMLKRGVALRIAVLNLLDVVGLALAAVFNGSGQDTESPLPMVAEGVTYRRTGGRYGWQAVRCCRAG